MLQFSKPNSKLRKLQDKIKKKVYSFDLLSGWTCPNADKCKSRVYQTDAGLRVKDGPNTWFRCFSASQEALWSNVYNLRRKNTEFVKKYHSQPKKLVNFFQSALPHDAEVVRFHVAGDFFSQNYMLAAIQLARQNPHIIFYSYTKSVGNWVKLRRLAPDNFRTTVSIGGRQDHLIDKTMKTVRVINNPDEQKIWNLDIDDDDSHAYYNRTDFLLLIHGIQPKIEN